MDAPMPGLPTLEPQAALTGGGGGEATPAFAPRGQGRGRELYSLVVLRRRERLKAASLKESISLGSRVLRGTA